MPALNLSLSLSFSLFLSRISQRQRGTLNPPRTLFRFRPALLGTSCSLSFWCAVWCLRACSVPDSCSRLVPSWSPVILNSPIAFAIHQHHHVPSSQFPVFFISPGLGVCSAGWTTRKVIHTTTVVTRTGYDESWSPSGLPIPAPYPYPSPSPSPSPCCPVLSCPVLSHAKVLPRPLPSRTWPCLPSLAFILPSSARNCVVSLSSDDGATLLQHLSLAIVKVAKQGFDHLKLDRS